MIQYKTCFVVCLFLLSATLAGCMRNYLRDGSSGVAGRDSIHTTVKEKLAENRADRTGEERWENFREDEYQIYAEIIKDAEQLAIDERRRELAVSLTSSGPLELTDCLAFAREFSEEIQAKRAAICAVKGEEVVARSRFLPHLIYGLDYEAVRLKREKEEEEEEEEMGLGFWLTPIPTAGPTPVATVIPPSSPEEDDEEHDEGSWTRSTDQVLLLTQTLLEFGKDNETDVVLRESERQVLFDYEDTVGRTLSDVRRTVFTILLRKEQSAERRKLLHEFRSRHEQMRKLEETRRVLEVDVLTARLNVLNEEARINSLNKEILRQRIELSRLLGLPMGMTDFDVRGDTEVFDMDLDEAVRTSVRRSTSIAEARAAVWEQERVLRQLAWEYAPDLHLQGGWRDKTATAGLGLTSENDTYGLSMFGEKQIDGQPDRGFSTENSVLGEEEQGWFVGAFLELDVFDGFERRGNRLKEEALLAEARHNLNFEIYAVETEVRKGYQTVLERRKELEILRETVDISWERLRVQRRLKELGKVTDNELETFRRQFFQDQDSFFLQQINLISAQEDLRSQMRYFEPLPTKGE